LIRRDDQSWDIVPEPRDPGSRGSESRKLQADTSWTTPEDDEGREADPAPQPEREAPLAHASSDAFEGSAAPPSLAAEERRSAAQEGSGPDTAGVEALPSNAKRGMLARIRRRWRQLVVVAVILLLLPYALIILYAPNFVHPVSSLMLRDLALLRGYDRQWVPFEKISPNLVQSVMMSEDGQFCMHAGVDWVQMRGVVDDALEGEQTRGASTIPMQTAKNLFLWNGRSFVRKAMELPLALAADFVWTKRRLMEIYLNIAEWGPGIYGAEAAAQHHFGVPASKLTRRQAALLAVSLPNPIDRNAGKPGRGLKRLAAMIERRAGASGEYIKCLYP
jgi:monofunctional biosynthetic peptidoglycan transglycosylase